MAVDGNGEVSACGRENIGIDLGFRDDTSGASVSISVSVSEEVDILSEGEDIMVGVSGAEIFFDGIYGAERQEEDVGVVRDDEDEFNHYELHIDQTLEIKDYGVYEVQETPAGGVESSDDIVSCVRALVQSLPMPDQISPQEKVPSFHMPGQISPQEVVESFTLPGQISPHELVSVVKPQSVASNHSFEDIKHGEINCPSSVLKRKRESIDVKPKECGSVGKKHIDVVSYSNMPSKFQEFEDFLSGSTKYSTAEDKTVSHLQMPAQAGVGDHNQNLEKPYSEESTVLPGLSGFDSVVFPVKDFKYSYREDMAIKTESQVNLPSVDTLKGIKPYKSVSTSLNAAGVPNSNLRVKAHNHVSEAATTEKYSPAELILTFDQTQSIPSASTLYNIFRRFGTLIETETLIYPESNCARVVFKKSNDAEIAVSSAKVFNIMGPSVIKYDLGYSPLSAMSLMQVTKSEAINVQEDESGVINTQEYEPQETHAQKMQFKHFEETSSAVATLASEEYGESDDVDIME